MAVVGLDLGTQSLKAVVLDDDLQLLGAAKIPYTAHFPEPNRAEQDARLWLDALPVAIGGAVERSGLSTHDIKGIGISGQLDGCVPVDAAGRALSPCIIWMDRRAEGEIAGIDPEFVRSRTGLVPDAAHMAAKIRWMKRHRPETGLCRTWHQPVSLVVEALCGRAVMDHALASTTMLYGFDERGFAPDLLALFGIDRAEMPEIAEAASEAGRLSAAGSRLTGLPAGISVAVGTGDDFANAIGAGVISPGIVSCTLGTGEVIGALSQRLVIDPERLLQTHSFTGGNYYLGNPGWLAGGAITWFLSTFGLENPVEVSTLAEGVTAGSDGLLFLPALSGAMAPRWIAAARGAFYGLTPAHGRASCARALLEGCAFAMRDVVDRLDALGVPAGRIRLCGGGARSAVWADMRADIGRRPVEVLEFADAAPLGAALLASVAVGDFDTIGDATSAMPRAIETIDPDESRMAIYDRTYHRYRTLFEALSPLYCETA
jgi:xylulokinase